MKFVYNITDSFEIVAVKLPYFLIQLKAKQAWVIPFPQIDENGLFFFKTDV